MYTHLHGGEYRMEKIKRRKMPSAFYPYRMALRAYDILSTLPFVVEYIVTYIFENKAVEKIGG